MNTTLPSDVTEFAASARRRLERLGGADLALRAERDRALREPVGAAIADLGGFELDIRTDPDQFLAATQLCRVAGQLALPWPVVEEMLSIDGARLALIDATMVRVDHGDLPGDWLGCDLDGTSYRLQLDEPRTAKLGPFLMAARLGDRGPDVDADDISRHLVLGSWRILGGIEASLAQVVEHVTVRKQFGQPLAEFQSVRFAVADASVAVRGLDELAKFTSWRLRSAPAAQRQVDAVGLRLCAAETATQVLRICHQLLGAVGFCDEHDVSVFDRHLQPLLRIPMSAERLAMRLVPAVRRGDLETLFT
jgi:acyl-CoA dehydrogenase